MASDSLPGTGEGASVAGSDAGNDDTEEDGTPDRLVALYERYIGEPERRIDVYAGFGLFFGGIALAALGLVTFLWSTGVATGSGLYWQLREIAIALSLFGLPAFMLGVAVLLPVDRRVVGAGGVGAAVCTLAVAVFVAVYPARWNVASGPDYSAEGITLYAAGMAVLAGAVGTALVGYHLQRARPDEGGVEVGGGAAGDADATAGAADAETVDDERVRRDIDEAMANAELSWGGVERVETERLELNTEGLDVDADATGFEAGTTTTRSSGDGVDDAVANLRGLQGNPEGEEARAESAEDTVAALNEFREQHGGPVETGADREEGIVDRLRRKLFD